MNEGGGGHKSSFHCTWTGPKGERVLMMLMMNDADDDHGKKRVNLR